MTTVAPQQCAFSRRERELLTHLTQGDTYGAIARRMGVSPHTVDTYMRRLRGKTGAENRTQLAIMAASLPRHDS